MSDRDPSEIAYGLSFYEYDAIVEDDCSLGPAAL
jgi:hypothetical protein